MATTSDDPRIVCYPFVGDLCGGSHISALHLIKRLDPLRYRPLVLLNQPEGEVAEVLRREQVPFTPAPRAGALSLQQSRSGPGYLVRDLKEMVAQIAPLTRFLRRNGVSIVHTNDGRMHGAWALPTKLAGARHVWHHRATPHSKGTRYLAPLLADRIVSVSDFALPKNLPMKLFGRPVVVRSPFDTDIGPVDHAASRAATLEEMGAPAESAVIGYVGSLVERKRPLTFVRTIAAMRRQAPERAICAPMFGDDPVGMSRAVADEAERLGVADCVRYMGFRYPVLRWFAGFDQLLVAAVDEPFGRTLIEAMLVGVVVVATASGGNVEAIVDGQTGALAPADDPEALAARALALIDDQAAMAAIRQRASDHVQAHFGLDRHAQAIMTLYDKLVTPRAAAAAGQSLRVGSAK